MVDDRCPPPDPWWEERNISISERDGQRLVAVRDDGDGFDETGDGAGQGLKNIRARSVAIDGAFDVRSRPGFGTELVVTLRA